MEPVTILIAALALGFGFVLGRYVFAPKGGTDTAERVRLQTELDLITRELKDTKAGLDDEQQKRIGARERVAELETELKNAAEKLAGLERHYTDTFAKLAHETLDKVTKQNNEQFLSLAKERLGKEQELSKGELEKREKAIETLVRPVNEMLEKYRTELQQVENSRQKAYGSLTEQVQSLIGNQEKLRAETSKLVDALKRPQVRGRWGEIQLRRVAELAGMLDRCDFDEQVSVTTEDGRLRPDMIVRLAGGKQIVVDAKAPLDAFMAALEAPTEEARKALIDKHVAQVRAHITQLSSKKYTDQFRDAPEFVVMFIPGESFFSAAVEHDRALIEDGAKSNVLIASPTTLITLLKAVYYGWQQEKLAENARRISDTGRDLYDRVRVLADHLAGVGDGLEKAVKSYNKAASSLETRFLPKARELKALGAGSDEDIPALEPRDVAARKLDAPELAPGAAPDAGEGPGGGSGEPH